MYNQVKLLSFFNNEANLFQVLIAKSILSRRIQVALFQNLFTLFMDCKKKSLCNNL